mmetsp:Transcript_84318/g.261906  ORF Transcript_84318/g.261906 Transcript_84318/m.261906 type:complete len:202 (+) Transcript_84318:1-606(+)
MFKRIRKEMIDNVLGTDMAHHFRNVSAFKTFSEKYSADPHTWCSDLAAMTSLSVMVLHAADISNPGKPTALSDMWTRRLKQEFFLQGDEEKRLGIPVSPLCDRSNSNFASSQVGFIKFIVCPTFELLERQAPMGEANILSEIAQNLELWEDRKRNEELGEHEVCKASQDHLPRLLSNISSGQGLRLLDDSESKGTPRTGGW